MLSGMNQSPEVMNPTELKTMKYPEWSPEEKDGKIGGDMRLSYPDICHIPIGQSTTCLVKGSQKECQSCDPCVDSIYCEGTSGPSFLIPQT